MIKEEETISGYVENEITKIKERLEELAKTEEGRKQIQDYINALDCLEKDEFKIDQNP